ncbi:MAG: hypothetical protein AAGJ34_01020 [Pseudomonadota bacterium]
MNRFALAACFVAATHVSAVWADDIEQGLQDALEAYQEGEIEETREILAFVSSQLDALKVDALSQFLPEAPDGWTREDEDLAAAGAAMGLFGMNGGQMAGARYSNESDTVSLTITVDSPMVAMLGGMMANPALLGGQGEVRRINRQNVLITTEGELQSVIDNRILVMIEGSNDADLLTQFFELVDVRGLKDF